MAELRVDLQVPSLANSHFFSPTRYSMGSQRIEHDWVAFTFTPVSVINSLGILPPHGFGVRQGYPKRLWELPSPISKYGLGMGERWKTGAMARGPAEPPGPVLGYLTSVTSSCWGMWNYNFSLSPALGLVPHSRATRDGSLITCYTKLICSFRQRQLFMYKITSNQNQ